MMNMSAPTLYTLDDLTDILKINRNDVGKLIKYGHLKAIKLGRIKVPDFEVERFMIENLGNDFSDFANVVEFDYMSTGGK